MHSFFYTYFAEEKVYISESPCYRTIAHAAATAHEWCSQDELDACKRELAEKRTRDRELQEQLHKLNTEVSY